MSKPWKEQQRTKRNILEENGMEGKREKEYSSIVTLGLSSAAELCKAYQATLLSLL
jgi:hypothetical protein